MKAAQIAQVVVIVLAAFGVYGFVSTAKDSESRRACSALCASASITPGATACSDFELPNLEGKKVKLSSYRGKV